MVNMVDKLHNYQGFYGRLHHIRDKAKEKFSNWKGEDREGVKGIAMNIIKTDFCSLAAPKEESIEDYEHIYRCVVGYKE